MMEESFLFFPPVVIIIYPHIGARQKLSVAVGASSILAHRSDPWVMQTCECVPRVNI